MDMFARKPGYGMALLHDVQTLRNTLIFFRDEYVVVLK